MCPRPGIGALACVLLALGLHAQQRVALPHGAGSLELRPGWTLLTTPDFAAETRPSDPSEEPARSVLQGMVAALRTAGRERDNVLLHAPGSVAGTVRIVNAYGIEGRLPGRTLREAAAADQIRAGFEKAMLSQDVTVRHLRTTYPNLFDVDIGAFTWALSDDDDSCHITLYVVPAGERIQYFETMDFAADPDGAGEIEALLRTFDSASEPPATNIWRSALVGGLTGGAAGFVVMLLRRGYRRWRPTSVPQPRR